MSCLTTRPLHHLLATTASRCASLRVDDARALALCEDDDGARSSVEIALVEPVAAATRCSSTPAPRWCGAA